MFVSHNLSSFLGVYGWRMRPFISPITPLYSKHWKVLSRIVTQLIKPDPFSAKVSSLQHVSEIQHYLLCLCPGALCNFSFPILLITAIIQYFTFLCKGSCRPLCSIFFTLFITNTLNMKWDKWIIEFLKHPIKLITLGIYVSVLRLSLEDLSWKNLTPWCNGIVAGTQWLSMFL